MAAPVTTLDVFSDVVCPWCYLGKRRLERALAALPARTALVTWRAYRLDPTIPRQGIDRDAYISRKFGSLATIESAHQRLTEMGRSEGIDYRFDLIKRSPNTLDAHRLIRWAAEEGRQETVVERLFAAYFTQGRDVGDRAVLTAIAAEAGLSGDVAARLETDDDLDAVEEEIKTAYGIGITGVPCFVVDRRLGIMGAQTPDVILDAIRQAEAPQSGAAAPA
jgi:predicted DsbA family dithiol-disulfide isomerase